jgi:hypothetical protein
VIVILAEVGIQYTGHTYNGNQDKFKPQSSAGHCKLRSSGGETAGYLSWLYRIYVMNNRIHSWLLLVSLSMTALTSPCANAEDIDLVVSADYVVTMDDKNTMIEKGAVAVDNGIIIAVDEQASIDGKYSPAKRITGENRVLMPGLVNGHTHAAMVLFRGVCAPRGLYHYTREPEDRKKTG